MLSRSIRSLSAAAIALTGVAVLAPSAQAAKPAPGWRVSLRLQFSSPLTQPTGVAASDTRSAWAIGSTTSENYSTVPESWHWNGKRWTRAGITEKQVTILWRVSTSGPTNTWAFGFKRISAGNDVSRSLHWDGRTWVTADMPNVGGTRPGISSSVTLGPKDTWAFGNLLGTSVPYIAHFTGKQWKRIAAPLTLKPGSISNAVALSRKNIWAQVVSPDYSCEVLHYDGRSWTIVKTPADFTTAGAGNSMVVRSNNDIWLAGGRLASSTQPFHAGALHYNGKKWSFTPVGPASGHVLRSIADDGQGGLWALTDRNPSELWHDVNGHWSKVTLANINNADLAAVYHIPGTSTTLGIGSDSIGPAIFVTGRF